MLIEDVLPGALAIGVPYETFWKLNPLSLSAYEKAHKLKAEVKAQEIDSIAWLNGAYVRSAVASALNKKAQYPKKPYGVNKPEESLEEKAFKFEQLALKINAQRKRKEG